MKFLANKLVRKTRKALSGDEKLNLEHNYGPVLRTMLRGEGFGEKAILENTTRTLTIAANSGHVFLVVLKKEHFAEL
jgi:CRP-like cAMP-binding protein